MPIRGGGFSKWETIADTLLGAAAASIDITSIATSYLCWKIYIFTKNTAGSTVTLTFNGDGGANYTDGYHGTNYAVTGLGNSAGTTSFYVQGSGGAGAVGGAIIDVINFAAGQTYMLHRMRNNDSQYNHQGFYNGAALISRVTFNNSGGNFDTGTRVVITGMKP
jgi:hypothetical protein